MESKNLPSQEQLREVGIELESLPTMKRAEDTYLELAERSSEGWDFHGTTIPRLAPSLVSRLRRYGKVVTTIYDKTTNKYLVLTKEKTGGRRMF